MTLKLTETVIIHTRIQNPSAKQLVYNEKCKVINIVTFIANSFGRNSKPGKRSCDHCHNLMHSAFVSFLLGALMEVSNG